MPSVIRTDSEIEDCASEASVRAEEASRYPGMSYEQGVFDALEWLTNPDYDNPMED